MEKLSKFLTRMIAGALLLTIGILCFIVNSKSKGSGNAFEAISIVSGVVLIILAALLFAAVLLLKRRVAVPEGLSAATLLSVGIFFVCDKTMGGMILTYIVEYVPYELVVVGSVFIVDAIIILVLALRNKTNGYLITVITECFTGGVTLLFGILALAVDGIKENKFLILGIILIIFALFYVLTGLLLLSESGFSFRRLKDDDDNVVDAEVISTKDVEENK